VTTRRSTRERLQPGRVLAALQRRAQMRQERGDEVECPACGNTFRRFKNAPNRPNAICWRCGAHERHRAMVLYWRRQPELFDGVHSLLHFAPEWALGLDRRRGLRYVSADLDVTKADRRLDIRALDLPDASFDAIVCSHVLEHVDRDRDALAELRRVVAPHGWVLLMVPQDLERATTYEDPSITDPAERERAFLQHDHVRLYGRDFAERVAETGFSVEQIAMTDHVGPDLAARYGLLASDVIHLCRPVPSEA
jgi:SAM-dependent methyltransferase